VIAGCWLLAAGWNEFGQIFKTCGFLYGWFSRRVHRAKDGFPLLAKLPMDQQSGFGLRPEKKERRIVNNLYPNKWHPAPNAQSLLLFPPYNFIDSFQQ